MYKIAMFNNKGGVGKTTLTCNLASHFAKKHGQRVLVVDCDPQCNATQLIMGIDFAADLYWNDESTYPNSTISDVLQPIEDGDAKINEIIKPIPYNQNRFGVSLIAGHPRLSIIEDKLSESWQQLLSGDLGGIRKSNWNSGLSEQIKDDFDYVFYDLGPSLGSINRSVLVGCDYFLTPMGSDIFSILGVRNIATWLASWISFYENGLLLCERQTPNRLSQFNVPIDLPIKTGYLGYTIQQYITKTRDGIRRATKAYEEIIQIVPYEVFNTLNPFSSSSLSMEDFKLGDVPHLYSLIPLGQSSASPILDLTNADGLVGPQFKQLEQFQILLDNISNRIIENLQKTHRE
jgi:cellulose biosynthesis protein BcsQ